MDISCPFHDVTLLLGFGRISDALEYPPRPLSSLRATEANPGRNPATGIFRISPNNYGLFIPRFAHPILLPATFTPLTFPLATYPAEIRTFPGEHMYNVNSLHLPRFHFGLTRQMNAPNGNDAGDSAGPGGEQQHSKRRRIGYACDVCRAKKNRCDGERPTCGPCQSRRIECLYSAQKSRASVTQE